MELISFPNFGKHRKHLKSLLSDKWSEMGNICKRGSKFLPNSQNVQMLKGNGMISLRLLTDQRHAQRHTKSKK